MKTCYEIFSPTFDESIIWGKDKYVTPMSDLVQFISKWIDDSASNSKSTYAIGTTKAYPRWKLREMAGFKDVPDHIKMFFPEADDACYEKDMAHAPPIDIESACKKAREWVELHESALDLLFES